MTRHSESVFGQISGQNSRGNGDSQSSQEDSEVIGGGAGERAVFGALQSSDKIAEAQVAAAAKTVAVSGWFSVKTRRRWWGRAPLWSCVRCDERVEAKWRCFHFEMNRRAVKREREREREILWQEWTRGEGNAQRRYVLLGCRSVQMRLPDSFILDRRLVRLVCVFHLLKGAFKHKKSCNVNRSTYFTILKRLHRLRLIELIVNFVCSFSSSSFEARSMHSLSIVTIVNRSCSTAFRSNQVVFSDLFCW
jgi:hypothetical protein